MIIDFDSEFTLVTITKPGINYQFIDLIAKNTTNISFTFIRPPIEDELTQLIIHCKPIIPTFLNFKSELEKVAIKSLIKQLTDKYPENCLSSPDNNIPIKIDSGTIHARYPCISPIKQDHIASEDQQHQIISDPGIYKSSGKWMTSESKLREKGFTISIPSDNTDIYVVYEFADKSSRYGTEDWKFTLMYKYDNRNMVSFHLIGKPIKPDTGIRFLLRYKNEWLFREPIYIGNGGNGSLYSV